MKEKEEEYEEETIPSLMFLHLIIYMFIYLLIGRGVVELELHAVYNPSSWQMAVMRSPNKEIQKLTDAPPVFLSFASWDEDVGNLNRKYKTYKEFYESYKNDYIIASWLLWPFEVFFMLSMWGAAGAYFIWNMFW